MVPSLAALIRSQTTLPLGEPRVVHGAPIAALADLPLLASLDALLGAWPDQVQAHLPDVADEASSITASPHDAKKLFASGLGLRFDDVERYLPSLVPWLVAIRGDLGLSAISQQRCLVYATPAGKGTAPHFDQNVNLVVQLVGEKTWTLAPNTHVAHPMTRHTMGLALDPELESYARLPMPDAMPADRTDLVLRPGSVLFVPRGMWHATRATTDALALNFTFSPPSWLELFGAALRSKLALSSAWRETAAPHAVTTFDALLAELAAEAPQWNAADILAATEG